MKKHFRHFACAVLCMAALSCVRYEEETAVSPSVESYPFITVLLPSGSTRTSYTFEDGLLKAFWAEGDIVSVVPDKYDYHYSGLYQVVDPDATTGKFQRIESLGRTSSQYGVYYPGDKIRSLTQFMNFSYTGQVQSKEAPTAHLGAYHSMRKDVDDYEVIDFTGADQSSCMRFLLSGMTFHSPSKITLTAIKGGEETSVFRENNSYSGYYIWYYGDEYQGDRPASSLSIDLEGYGDENSLTAWMMMSNSNVSLAKGTILRVKVKCSDGTYYADTRLSSDFTLEGGRCHTMSVDSGWISGSGELRIPEYNGEVVTLQEASYGNGIDLVIMGDGFIEEDFENGTYDTRMRKVYDSFFSVMPQAALKNRFNVYYVKAVSPERLNATNTGANGASNSDSDTKFNTTFTPNSTSVTGDGDRVLEYARKALTVDTEDRMLDVTIVVLANQNCRAGTCHVNYWYENGTDYGQACSYAFCALGKSEQEGIELIHHEVDGHGFGKLGDEYYSNDGRYNSGWWNNMKQYHELALYRNVDIFVDDYIYGQWGSQLSLTLTTRENVLWHDMFGTSNRYEDTGVESLGVFEGAFLHNVGFCRPTENGNSSIMYSNKGIFNAPSRRAIYYRAMRLSGEITGNIYGTAAELNNFLEWDASVFLPTLSSIRSTEEEKTLHPLVEDSPAPLAPPVVHIGRWDSGKFIVEENL